MLLTVTSSQIFGCKANFVGSTFTHNASDAKRSSVNHLIEVPDNLGVKVHRAALAPLQELKAAAKLAGFNLMVASGFRSFERQRLIWNKKCCGQRPVLDHAGHKIDLQSLSAEDKVHAICRWSALPGASRHHWGTDCDIYDALAVTEDYPLQLHPKEYSGDGPFAPMMAWLNDYLQQPDSPEFYQPYAIDHDGVAPEPWHISYRPVASIFEKYFSVTDLKTLLKNSDVEECDVITDKLDDIYQRFIKLPGSNYPI